MRTARLAVCAAACGAATLVAACGKKGPPLPPFVRIPAAVTTLAVDRVGDDVYVTATLPERNIDGSLPASTTRVDIWAFTGRVAPARAAWANVGTLIGSVDLVPAEPDDDVVLAAGAPTAPSVPPTQVAVHERLTPDLLEPRVPDAAAAATTSAPVRRFYVAVPVGTRNRPGPLGTVTELDLGARPGPPVELAVSYDQSMFTLSWAAAPDGDAWIAARQTAARAAGSLLVPDARPWRYNVYRSGRVPAAVAPSGAAGPTALGAPRPRPANAAPLSAPPFTLPVAFEVETCFSVRALFTGDGPPIEGRSAPEVCVTPVDSFPPTAPRQLAALPSGDAIDLIWESNDESDLGGYHVLRGESPDAPLRRLTTAPVAETRFRDMSVKKGVKYYYAVVAIDKRAPEPNVSAESNRVEEEPR